MSTPHQGPGMWQQGDQQAAAAWLANLNAEQQERLQRKISGEPHPALAPIYNAVNRVREVANQQATRLSQYAQRLASQGAERGRNAVTQVTEFGQNAANRATEIGQNAATRATELGRQAADLGRQGRDGVVNAAERTGAVAANATVRAVDGASAAGRQVAQTASNVGQRIADAGRQAADAGRQVAGNVGRWFQEKQSNASNRANAARAAFTAFRQDPTLQQTAVPSKDVLQLAEKFHDLINAPNAEAQREAAERIVQLAGEMGANPQAHQTQEGSGRHRAENSTAKANPTWALEGNPAAGGAVSLKKAATSEQGQHGEAPTTGSPNKHRKEGPDHGK